MAIPSLTQHKPNGVAATTSTTLAFTGPVAVGDLILAKVRFGDVGETITVSDNVNPGNYTQDAVATLATDSDTVLVFSKIATVAGTPTLALALSAAASIQWAIEDWAPGTGNTWQAAAQSTHANATGAAISSGSITTTAANALIAGVAGYDNSQNTTVAGAGSTTFLDRWAAASPSALTLSTGYQLVASTGSYATQFTIGASCEYAALVVAYPYSSGVTDSLSGQTATFTEGTLPAEGIAYAPTAQTVTSSEGAPARAATYTLSGQTATFAEGTISASAGSSVSRSLTAQSATFTEGSLAPNVGYVLNDGVPLTGQTATFAEGSATGSVTYTLTGQISTFAEGTIGASSSRPLAGQSVTSSEGTLQRAAGFALSGQTLTLTEGSISVSTGGNVTVSLSGQTVTSAEGSLVRSAGYSATGQSISSSESSMLPALTYGAPSQTGTLSEGSISVSLAGNVTLSLHGQTIVSTEGIIASVGGAKIIVIGEAFVAVRPGAFTVADRWTFNGTRH